MSLENFKIIADKIKAKGLQIGSMFCFGEPLMDPTLTDKYAYAIAHYGIDVLTGCVTLNTNCSHLTPDRYEGLLRWTSMITLSFFNTGREYEELTGLSWEKSYTNALSFIKYAKSVNPLYQINIGTNPVPGSNLENVKKAFAGLDVNFVSDVYFSWTGSVLAGPLKRLVNLPDHRCDGHRGALQVMWNGDCLACAFDIAGTPNGGDTVFGNILTDSWEQLEAAFREKWRAGFSLCRKCDYFHHAKEVIANDGKLPSPLPECWHDWQKPYLKPGEVAYD